MCIIYEIIYVCKVFLQLLFPNVKIHNISFYGKNGIQFMNTHFVSQIVTIFCKWSTRWLSLCNVGSVPDFSQATACTLILSGMTEFLLRALKKIERGRKLSLPSLNLFAWLNDAKIGTTYSSSHLVWIGSTENLHFHFGPPNAINPST